MCAETLLALSDRAEAIGQCSQLSSPSNSQQSVPASPGLNDSVVSNSSDTSQSGRRLAVTGYVEVEVVGATVKSYDGCGQCKTKMQTDAKGRAICPNKHVVDSKTYKMISVSRFISDCRFFITFTVKCLQLRLLDESASGNATWFGSAVFGALGMEVKDVKLEELLGPAVLELKTRDKLDFIVQTFSRLPQRAAIEIPPDYGWEEFW